MATDRSVPELVGVLGGVFDPPHVGHLAMALSALSELALDELIVVPNAAPPLGKKPVLSSIDRLSLAHRVFGELPRVRVSDLELRMAELAPEGVVYTVDLLERLRVGRPGTTWVLLVGADQAVSLARGEWHRTPDLLEACQLAIAQRPGVDEDVLELAVASLRAAGVVVHELRTPLLRISSSAIRAAMTAGDLDSDLLRLVPEIPPHELIGLAVGAERGTP